MKNATNVTRRIFCSIYQFLYKSSQRVKNEILQEMRKFYFSSDFDRFFAFDSSHSELSTVCQQIFSICHRFQHIIMTKKHCLHTYSKVHLLTFHTSKVLRWYHAALGKHLSWFCQESLSLT